MTMMLGLDGLEDGHARPMTAQVESDAGPIWFFYSTDNGVVRKLGKGEGKGGDIKVTALFIAPVEKTPGDGLNAGCLRIDGDVKPPEDAPLVLEGQPVRE